MLTVEAAGLYWRNLSRLHKERTMAQTVSATHFKLRAKENLPEAFHEALEKVGQAHALCELVRPAAGEWDSVLAQQVGVIEDLVIQAYALLRSIKGTLQAKR
jgi:hypothetical protein